jgi:tRNA dimethylallyltransferase
MTSRVVVITGPTASGKTDIAIALQERLGGPKAARLISVDSAMIYREMNIGTAKPDPATLALHPHELIDVRDPAETYSAAEFVAAADELVLASVQAGQVPILVGGTMMYLRCFREGIAALPKADPVLRAALEEELRERGAVSLHDELTAIDPRAAANIHPHNSQRLLRALEVCRSSGKPMSALWSAQRSCDQRLGVRQTTYAVSGGDRAELHARIEQRFDAMLAAGFLDEVSALRARGDLHLGMPSMRAVGYRQAWRHLQGEIDRDECREQAIAATRQLAKRQLTWLRRWRERWSDVHHLTPAPSAEIAGRIADALGS